MVVTSTSAINRDVGEQAKGPRLQRLRAVARMLEAMERPEPSNVYCAVELGADVHVADMSSGRVRKYYEEDKNYDPNTNFTIMSHEVRNTMVIFLDCWAERDFSRNVIFGFYTPSGIGAEKISETSKRLGISWPTAPILELLATGQAAQKDILNCVKLVVLDEYRKQYNGLNKPGYIRIFESWTDDEWIDFLQRIEWKFGQEDQAALESTILRMIRNSKHFHEGLAGKEPYILSAMLDFLDKRQSAQDQVARYIHSSEVQLIFMEIGAGSIKLPDPAWKTWESLSAPDTRNLQQKIEAVGEGISKPNIGRWSRSASNSLIEQEELRHEKSLLSLKYQVFDACEKELARLIRQNGNKRLTSSAIEEWVEELVSIARERLRDRSAEYHYPARSNDFLRCLVWQLIDSCFLAFDSGDEYD